jgi:hypothetical protein
MWAYLQTAVYTIPPDTESKLHAGIQSAMVERISRAKTSEGKNFL